MTGPRNCDLLRQAGEHLGSLAEKAKLIYERYQGQRGAGVTAKKFYNEYARLARLSTEVLREAGGER